MGLENGTTVGYEVNLSVITQQLEAAPDLFIQFVFEVDAPISASPNPFPWTEGGGLWLDVAFPNLGPPVVQALVWNPLTNQWEVNTDISDNVQVTLQPIAPGGVAVELFMPGSVNIPGLPMEITVTGVRILTGEQSSTPQAIDVMPEPSAQDPAVYDQFIDLGSCAPGSL